MSDDQKNAGFLVNEDALKQAKNNCEHGELSDELRKTVNRLAYGAETTERERLREKLETHRENIHTLRSEIQQKEQTLNEERRKAQRVEERLDTLRDMDAHYEGMLDSISSDLQDGKRVFEGQQRVAKAAEAGGRSESEVLDDLRQMNPDVPEEAFRQPKADEEPQWRDASGVELSSV